MLLGKTKAGVHARTVEDIKNILRELLQEYKLKGKIDYNGHDTEINKCTHREMAREFAALLDYLRGK